jgi:trk system potassium uptake protein TrkA
MFLNKQAQLIALRLDDECPVLNTPLKQLTDLFSTLRTLVVAIRRQGTLFAPESGDQLFSGDECYLMCHVDDSHRSVEVFGKPNLEQNRIVLIGGGNVGQRVAYQLEKYKKRISAKIIEKNIKIAEAAAENLERTIVLNGDGLDVNILSEANVSRADTVLAITDDDKTNMLAAVRAKAQGCKMAVVLINDPTLVPLMQPLGIDAYINPRATTVSSILRHIRHGRVKGVYAIGDAEAEILEAEVLSTSPIAGQKIRDIEFPESVLIGGLLKNGEFIKPSGGTLIEEGDTIALFTMAEDIPEVERLLQVSIDFF